jgi:hypothetical protein
LHASKTCSFQLEPLAVPNGFHLLNSDIRLHFFGAGSVDDINLFDLAFTTTLLQLGDEDFLHGMITVHCHFEPDGRRRLPAHTMPSLNRRITFSGELFTVAHEEMVIAIDMISHTT